jgi:hypothetical protein
MNTNSKLLLLKTNDLPADDKDNNSFRWRNIGLRTLLGSMYDKYDKFKLCIDSFAIGGLTYANVNDRCLNINIYGLDFETFYDTNTLTCINYGIASSVNLNDGDGTVINLNGLTGLTFRKPSSNTVDITLYYSRVASDDIDDAISYPNATFIFSIYGIE